MVKIIGAAQFNIRQRKARHEQVCRVKMLKKKERKRRGLRNENAEAMDKHGKVVQLKESLIQNFRLGTSMEVSVCDNFICCC